MNRRKQTKWPEHQDVRNMDAAAIHAAQIGLPLNCFVTIAPCRSQAAPASAADYFISIRNHLGVWCRRHTRKPFTAIWVAHAASDGSDPHIHLLMHLPVKFQADLEAALAIQYPGPDVAHCRRDDGRVRQHESGYWSSTLNYMRRFMSQQAWWALGKHVRRERNPAPFVGKRWGTTANLSARARKARQGQALAASGRCRVTNERRAIAA